MDGQAGNGQQLFAESLPQGPDYAARAKQWAEYQANLAANAEMQATPIYPFHAQYSHYYAQQEAATLEYQRHSRRGHAQEQQDYAAQHGHSRFRSDSSDGKGMLAGPASMEAVRPGSPLTWSPGSATEASMSFPSNLYSTASQESALPPRSPIRSQDSNGAHSGSQPSTPVHAGVDPAVFSSAPSTPLFAASADPDATISASKQQNRGAIPFPTEAAQERVAVSTESPLKVTIRQRPVSTTTPPPAVMQQEQMATPALTFSPACDEGMPESASVVEYASVPVSSGAGTQLVTRPPLLQTASDSMLLRPHTAMVPTSASAMQIFPEMPAPRVRQASMPALSSFNGENIPAPEIITYTEAQARYMQQQAYLEQYAAAYPEHAYYYYGAAAGPAQTATYSFPAHTRVWSASSSEAAASPVTAGPMEGIAQAGFIHERQNTYPSGLSVNNGLSPSYPNFAHPGLMRNISSSSSASSLSAQSYESALSTPGSARSVSPFGQPVGTPQHALVGLGIETFSQAAPLSAPPIPASNEEWYAVQSGIGATEWHWAGYSPTVQTPLSEGEHQMASLQLADSLPIVSGPISDLGEPPFAHSTIRARRNTRSAPYPRASMTTKRAGRVAAPNDLNKLPAHGKVTKGRSTPSPVMPDIDAPLHMLPTKRSRGRRPVDSNALDVCPEVDATMASTRDQLAFSGVTKTGKPKKIFICRVPGCDKCFRRGEHPKRHIRSLHTLDKRRSLASYTCWQAC